MLKIGEGYYYNVYALDSLRVIKKQTSYTTKFFKLFVWYWSKPLELVTAVLNIKNTKDESIARSRQLIQIPELRYLLGNPKFINEFEYEQDRAMSMIELLHSVNEDVYLGLIQKYTEIVLSLWRFGYGDQVYNFTFNTGVSNKTNQLILIDFNELTKNKVKVAEDIEKQKWLAQRSMIDLKAHHPLLWEGTHDILHNTLTLTALNSRWPTISE